MNIESIANKIQNRSGADEEFLCDVRESLHQPALRETNYISLEVGTRAASPMPSIYKSVTRKSPPADPMCMRYQTKSPIYMNANLSENTRNKL